MPDPSLTKRWRGRESDLRPPPRKWRCHYCNGINLRDMPTCQFCDAPVAPNQLAAMFPSITQGGNT
jgi:hypothetical protein